MKKVAILGYGGRGTLYTRLCKSLPKDYEITAIIDTNIEKLNSAKKEYNISDKDLFVSIDDFLCAPKRADWLFVCTQDKQHFEHATKAIKQGYNLLLEKPIATTLEDCLEIERVAKEHNVKVAVCHVLRYSSYYEKIKEIIDSGILGKIIAIDQTENVGYWHQAHSFVRGDWGNSEQSTPMILAKCCHDLDIAVYLTQSKCVQVTSQGDLHYFKKENAPEGATQYCTGGCKAKETCPYDCEKIYLDPIKHKRKSKLAYRWPQARLMNDGIVTKEKIKEALNGGQFGRCVFMCDNDVVDYQVTTMKFENGINSTLTMTAFSQNISRETRIRGTLGELVCDMLKNQIILQLFGKKPCKIKLNKLDSHGGGDMRLIIGLAKDEIKTDISQSVESHLIAFGAELSRKTGKPVNLKELRKN